MFKIIHTYLNIFVIEVRFFHLQYIKRMRYQVTIQPISSLFLSGNFPVPFHGSLLSSGLGLGSSAIHAKTQSASQLMDGLSYGMSRVPAYIGYGVQSAGQLERTGEQLFKSVVDLGTGGVANGMQGG